MTEFDWSKEENRCFGCGDNPIGLKLDFRRSGNWLTASTKLDKNYQGFRNSAHGGIVATLLDEASAWAAMAETGHLAPSYELNCKFLEPVPLNEEISVRAIVIEERHGVVQSKSEVRNAAGKILARGEASSRVLEAKIDSEESELL